MSRNVVQVLVQEKGSLEKVRMYSVKWTIDRFLADCKNTGEYYVSPVFPITFANQVTKWHLTVHPLGVNEQFDDSVSLFLHCTCDASTEVKVKARLSIISGDEMSHGVIESQLTFQGPKYNWGAYELLTLAELKNPENNCLINDRAVLLCEIRLNPEVERYYGYDEYINKIGPGCDHYERLFESKRFTDAIFHVQDNTIPVHKAILSYRSPILAKMFKNEDEINDGHEVIFVSDIAYEVMIEFFRFIYANKVKNIEQLATQLLAAADKYDVVELKALCEKFLYERISIDNAIDYLILTDKYNTINLKPLTIEFIGAHHAEIARKPAFVDLNNSLMHEIIMAIPKRN
ncbi:speckle-type POZ protein-like [Phymastichus coffea]|uniref:speckle-type POZ protein-like n=1 Tax=Phymastichus coffea TaxID=108790 RepID=UPI00273C19CB|nr:speckle-type POZ protein-like [Phymastichus coffea]